MTLPGFKTTTTTRTNTLDAAVQLVFTRLKEKYPSRRVDDLASISSGGTPSRNDTTFFGGDIPWAKIGDITSAGKWISETEEYITQSAIEQSSAKIFPAGTVLFSMYGSIGKTSITTCPMASNQAILGLIPNTDIDSEYLYYALINARAKLFSQSKGTSQKNINGRMVKEFEIPTPPKSEAKKIIEFLSLIEEDESTDFLQDLPEYLKEIRRIVARIQALAARVSQAQNLRRETVAEVGSFIQAIQREIFSKAADWQTCILDDVAPINMGQSPPGDSYNIDREGVPLLNGPTEFGHKYPTPVQWTTNPTKFCKSGDILICVRGATTGKMNWADQNYCIGRGLAALSVDTNKCVPEYVYYFVKTQTQEILSRTAGSTFPNLPREKLKTLPIPVPPLDEQQRLVTYIASLQTQVEALHHLQAEVQTELDALLPSILDRAFNGEL